MKNCIQDYGIIFTDITELINNKKYMIHGVPCTYGPIESYWFNNTSPGPVYTPLRGEKGTGMYSIASLIDMYFNKVDFKFNSYDQMREIERYLGTYIAVIEQDEKFLNREQKEYLNRARDLFKFLTGKVEHLNNRDADIRKAKELKTNPFLREVVQTTWK